MSEPKEQENIESSEMPMLAGSAASRLARSILTRLSSPFAHASASPVRPTALWRQVGRRLGILPEAVPGRSIQPQRPLGHIAQPEARDVAHDPFSLLTEPEVEFVWRTEHHHDPRQHEEGAAPESRFILPATRITPVPLPQQAEPAVAQPPPLPPATAPQLPADVQQSAPQQPAVTPLPAPEPASSPSVAPTPIPAPPVTEVPTVQPTPPVADLAAMQPPIAPPLATSPSSPPVLVPAKVVTVEYLPGPAAMPLQPLIAPEPLLQPHTPMVGPPFALGMSAPLSQPPLTSQANYDIAPTASRNLADELNQDLIPTTDLLSRMVRATNVELPTPQREPVVQAEAVQQPTSSTMPSAPIPSAPSVPTAMADEAPRLEMPLIPQQGVPRATTQQAEPLSVEEAIRRAERPIEREERGPVGKFFDRVVDSLPDPIRRFFAERDRASRDEALAAPPMAEVQPVPQTIAPPAPPPAPSHSQDQLAQAGVSAPAASEHQVEPAQPYQQSIITPTQVAPPALPSIEAVPQPHVSTPPPTSPPLISQTQPPQGPASTSDGGEPVLQRAQADPAPARVSPELREGRSASREVPARPAEQKADVTSASGPQVRGESTPLASSTVESTTAIAKTESSAIVEGSPELTGERMVTSDRGPQGLLGSFVTRFLGRGGTEGDGSRTPAIDMPWARRGRTSAQAESAAHPEESEFLPIPVRPARVERPIQAAAPPPPNPAAAPTPDVNPEPTTAPQVSSAPTQPEVLTPTAPTLPAVVQPEVVPAAMDSTTVSTQDTATTASQVSSPAPAATPAMDGDVIPEPQVQMESLPATAPEALDDARPVVQSTYIPEGPKPVEMPHASRRTENVEPELPEIELPAARLPEFEQPPAPPPLSAAAPSITESPPSVTVVYTQPVTEPETPRPEATQPAASQIPEALLAQPVEPTVQAETIPAHAAAAQETSEVAEQQAWQTFAQVAQDLARAHMPLSQVEPMETSAQSGLLSRLLDGPSRMGVAPELLIGPDVAEPRAVPAPITGAASELPVARSVPQPSASRSVEDAIAHATAQPALAAQTQIQAAQSTAPATTPPSTYAPTTVGQITPPTTQLSPAPPTDVTYTPPAAPIGFSASLPLAAQQPLVRPAMTPDTLRDIRTGIPSTAATRTDMPSPPPATTAPSPMPLPATAETPEMTQRFITDVSPATYEMDRMAVSATPSNLSDLTASPTIMRSISEMAPSIGSIAEPDSTTPSEQTIIQDEQSGDLPWMRALRELYGNKQDEAMPLAIPYGAFALPRGEAPAIPGWMREAIGEIGSTVRPAAASFGPISMPTPSIPTSSYSQVGSQSSGSISSFSAAGQSWSDAPASSSYDDGASGETDAWAGVIADAVSDVGAATPALALAGEEAGGGESQSSNQNQQSEEGDKPAGGADVDELAESVYTILRRRLAIERERNFA